VTPGILSDALVKLRNDPTPGGEPKSPSTVVRYCAALSHALTYAVQWEWLNENPMRKVKKPQEPRGRVRYLSVEERGRLLEACSDGRNHYLHAVVTLALMTGMRKGEIMGLRWSDVDLERRRIVLQETKNGERRAVPIVGPALKVLSEWAKVRRLDTDLLFPSKVDASKPMDLRTPWETALKHAGIGDFRFHDLRHSAASYLAMSGASLAEIAEVLGHKTLQMVKRYSHLSETHTASVLERMGEKFMS
jgi:integrase